MRNYFQVVITVCVLAAIHNTSYSQTTNTDSINHTMNSREEAFGKLVFHAFQANDEALYAALQPTNEEYKALLQRWLAAKVKGLTQTKIDEMMERRKREASARIKQDFADYRAQATSAGVV